MKSQVRIGRAFLFGVVALLCVALGSPGVLASGPPISLVDHHQRVTAMRVRQNWPCSGCVVSIPSTYRAGEPSAILVALHGDEGTSALIANSWETAAQRANVILFAPQCPTNRGCRLQNGTVGFTNSWWGWLQSSKGYDDRWIGQQVAKIGSKYNIDRAREYLTGWSGGADYLGWYALRHAAQFAAVAFVAGGVPYTGTCPSRRMAAYFLMGATDFRYLSGQPSQVRDILRRCGESTRLVVFRGADHGMTASAISSRSYGTKILNWLLGHTRAT